MESREEPPDCSYLSIILHVYGGNFLYDISLVYLCKSCGNVYIVHAEIVSIL